MISIEVENLHEVFMYMKKIKNTKLVSLEKGKSKYGTIMNLETPLSKSDFKEGLFEFIKKGK